MSRLRVALFHVVLPLVLGAVSYVVLRSWAPILGTHAALWPLAPAWLRDHFADAAWGWALGGFVTVMWLDAKPAPRALWTLAAVAVAACVELAQLHGGRGAFDFADLVVQTSAVLVCSGIIGGMNRWTTAREAR